MSRNRRGRFSRLRLAALAVVALGLASAVLAYLVLAREEPSRLTNTLTIEGEEGRVIQGVHITSESGPCLVIRDSSDVIVRDSEIGPCGGNGIIIDRSSNVQVLNSYIHPEYPVSDCCDKGDGILAMLSSDLLIQGNVVAYGESNVELLGVKDVRVIGNFLLNPLGPFPRGSQIQVWSYTDTRSSNVRVEDNYALASRDPKYAWPEGQTDAINFGQVDGVVAEGNYITGGRFHAGCGLIADKSANSVQFLNNTLLETGQCGIGIAGGTDQVVDGNRVYNHGIEGDVGNVAIYVWNVYSEPCGPVQISNNVAVLIQPAGNFNSYWEGGTACRPVTLTNNTFNQAAIEALAPIEINHPPPPGPMRQYERWMADRRASSE